MTCDKASEPAVPAHGVRPSSPATSKNLYVGGALGDVVRVRRLMQACISEGHALTLDWTTLPVGPSGADHSARAAAMRDAVLACDVFVLADHLAARGALVELGVALGAGIPAVVCTAVRWSDFFELSGVVQVADHELCATLRSI